MKRLAVLGHPVAHSRSPAMQNAALAELAKRGLEGQWVYEEPIDVPPEGFEGQVRAMAAADYVGANVTIPHKEAALSLADTKSPAAEAIGAANTLKFVSGRIHAENTDASGLLGALEGSVRGWRALVLGAGGAARAVVWALVSEGAEVEVWNRTAGRARDLCAELGGAPIDGPDAASYELLVNATAVGLHDEDPFDELPLSYTDLGPRQTVVDLVYGPTGTRLLAIAGHSGAKVVTGFEILVRQGARSLELWTGMGAPLDVMRAAVPG